MTGCPKFLWFGPLFTGLKFRLDAWGNFLSRAGQVNVYWPLLNWWTFLSLISCKGNCFESICDRLSSWRLFCWKSTFWKRMLLRDFNKTSRGQRRGRPCSMIFQFINCSIAVMNCPATCLAILHFITLSLNSFRVLIQACPAGAWNAWLGTVTKFWRLLMCSPFPWR